MKILYISVFFLGMAAISALAFGLLQGIDNGAPAWVQLVRGAALLLAIALLVLFILRYIRNGAGSNDK